MKQFLSRRHRHSHRPTVPSSYFIIPVVMLALLVLAPMEAVAQKNSPARPVPQDIWQGHELRPVDPDPIPRERDQTSHNEFNGGAAATKDFWPALDVDGNFIYAALAHGLQIWSVADDPTSPKLVSEVRATNTNFGAPTGIWPEWCKQFEKQFILADISVPPGRGDVAVLGGSCSVGVTIFDTSNRSSPILAVQDAGFDANDVHAFVVNNTAYAVATGSKGFRVYNLDAARQHHDCLIGEGPCDSVLVRDYNDPRQFVSVDGVDNYVAAAKGGGGLEIFDLSNPAQPVTKADMPFSNVQGASVRAASMWRTGSNIFIAIALDSFVPGLGVVSDAQIYNASCIAQGGSCTPTRVGNWSQRLGPGGPIFTVSRAGNVPFLFIGSDNRASTGLQREWLLDLSNPNNPKDVTPPPAVCSACEGELTGYWGWYYENNPTGFHWVVPRMGKFQGDYFYRAVLGIFDVHQLLRAQPPTADFTWESQEPDGKIYGGGDGIGSLVDFIDQSVGAVDALFWAFNEATPSTDIQTPGSAGPVVRFDIPGSHRVTLTAENGVGEHSRSRNVTVLSPDPALTQVESNVSAAPVCGTVTFTAEGASGKPPLGYAWRILDSGDNEIQPAPSSVNAATFQWTSDSGLAPGAYSAEVTVSNAFGPDTVLKSDPVVVSGLDVLAVEQPVLDNLLAGSASFSVVSAGATSWTWDFGDGTNPVTTTDPLEGPNQNHTYQEIGTYEVTVTVDNCRDQAITSETLIIDIDQVAPLNAEFAARGLFCQANSCFADPQEAIDFEDNSTGADKWEYDWDGNGTIDEVSSNGPITSHTYTSAGSFRPTLTVSRGDGAETDTFVHRLIVVGTVTLPTASITGPSSGITGTAYTFTASCNVANSNTGWSWNTGGGVINGSATGRTVLVTWNSPGRKTITASHSGCERGSRSINISNPNQGGGDPPPPPPPGGGDDPVAVFTGPATGSVGQAVSFNASSSIGNITTYEWDFGDGETTRTSSPIVNHVYRDAGQYTVSLSVIAPSDSCTNNRFGCADDAERSITIGGGGNPGPNPNAPTSTSCVDDPKALCLLDNHFRIKVEWRDHRSGDEGVATPLPTDPLPGQDTTGFFWFFNPNSVDLIVKVVDGSTVNDSFWFFSGSLSDVEYTITVIDETTTPPTVKEYSNAAGNICGEADVEAFPLVGADALKAEFAAQGVTCSALGCFADTGVPITFEDRSRHAESWEYDWDGDGEFDQASTTGPIESHTFTEAGNFRPVLRVSRDGGAEVAIFEHRLLVVTDSDASRAQTAGASETVPITAPGLAAGSCEPDQETLCLLDGQFEVTVDWNNPRIAGDSGTGRAIQGTSETGYFWFFSPSNVELVVKMIDAQAVNGHYWFFFGALTDVEYTLQVRNLETGEIRSFENQAGNICGQADTEAF